MILLIEPNAGTRKRLCDLLPRERIIGIESYSQTLEMICKFKNNLNIIIAYIRMMREIMARKTLFRLCETLYIHIPPVLVFYKKGDDIIRDEFEKKYPEFKLLKLDLDDTSFPEQYIGQVREIYPEVIADVEEATRNWLKADQAPVIADPRQWLIEQGFLKALKDSDLDMITKDIKEILPLIKKMVAATETTKNPSPQYVVDYEKMYNELKKRYDLLVKYIKDLAHTTKTPGL